MTLNDIVKVSEGQIYKIANILIFETIVDPRVTMQYINFTIDLECDHELQKAYCIKNPVKWTE